MAIKHSIEPIFDDKSEVLILGSFPSVKSREQNFFYGHPQNRFWKVVSAVCGKAEPKTISEKREFLLSERIAVWDVIGSCKIEGSSDSSIREVVPNDIGKILEIARIKRIFVNGKSAEKYYNKYIRNTVGIDASALPSTSPANAVYGLERLIEEWRVIRERVAEDVDTLRV